MRIDCIRCKSTTNHEVVKETTYHDVSPDGDVHVGGAHQIVRCLGCGESSFREESWCSEDLDPYTGQVEKRQTLYPSRTEGRREVEAAIYLPPKVSCIYGEMLKALNASAPTLAALGLRTLVEAVCIDQKSAGRTLQAKIDGLVNTGAISKKQAEFLHEHRFMGNEAAHEVETPPARDLLVALDIVESVLQAVYELPEMASRLKASRERRSAKRKSTKRSKPRG